MALRNVSPLWRLLLAAGAIFLTAHTASAATNFVWNNPAGGNWSVATNWTPNGVPGTAPGDSARITLDGTYAVTLDVTPANPLNQFAVDGQSGTQTLNINSTTLNVINRGDIGFEGVLNLRGGILTGPGDLHIDGIMNWTGGTISGSGSGVLSVRPLGRLTLGTLAAKTLVRRSIFNAGTTTWSGAGHLDSLLLDSTGSASDFFFNNSGTFIAQNAQTITPLNGAPVFNNTGTFIKSGGSGAITFGFGVTFNNGGTVSVDSGTLRLLGGGSNQIANSHGLFAGVGTLAFIAGTYNVDALSEMTTSNVVFSGGTANIAGRYDVVSTTINGGTANFNVPANVPATSDNASLSAGILGGSGKFIVSDLLDWTGGTMSGSGATEVGPSGILLIFGTAPKTLLQRRFDNRGAGSWGGTGDLNLGSEAASASAIFNNSGTFAATTNQSVNWCCGNNRPVFNNTGTFTKRTGTGVTTFSGGVVFNNDGTVEVNRGTLRLSGGGSSAGSFGGTATLEFNGGTHALTTSSSITASNVVFSGGQVNYAGHQLSIANATINGGTANLIANASASSTHIDNLTLSSGVLTGSAALNVTRLDWTGGTMSGSGITNIGTALNLSGGNAKTLLQRTVDNLGTATWSGTGDFNMGSEANSPGTEFINEGRFEAQNDQSVNWCCGNSPPRFHNVGAVTIPNQERPAGVFIKSDGAGATTFGGGVAFNNDGTVRVNSGTLRLSGGGLSNSVFAAALFQGTATLEFNGGTYDLSNTANITVANVLISGGTVNDGGSYNVPGTAITGGTANFNGLTAANTLALSGGTLAGSANLLVDGALNWTGGTMSGSGITTIRPGAALNITGSADKRLLRRTVDNRGTATWSGFGTLQMGSEASGVGASFNNSGTFVVQNDSTVSWCCGNSPPVFNNTGTFTKSAGSGFTAFFADVPFNNNGTVNVNSGTLSLSAGNSVGLFQGGGTLRFAAGTHNLNAGSRVTVANVFFGNAFGGGGTINVAGSYNVAGTTINGGTANFNHGATSTSVALVKGTLGGSATFIVKGTMDWTGGTMSGTGILRIPGTRHLNISGSDAKTLLQRTVDNQGTATWSGTGNLNLGSEASGAGASINNSGTFVVQNDAIVSWCCGNNPPAFHNSGTFTKSAGAGVTTFGSGVPFDNSNTVNADSGTLRFNGGYVQTAGTTSLNGGSIASSGTIANQAGLLTGSGTITGNVSNGGTVSPGASPGILNIAGNYTQAALSRLRIELNGTTPGTGYDRLNVSGNVSLDGVLTPSAGFPIPGGATFIILNKTSPGPVSGTFSQRPEGSVSVVGTAFCQITYVGGDGNDVALIAVPTMSINDVTRAEGSASTTNFNFTVTLSATSSMPVTVAYALQGGTATTPVDYGAATDSDGGTPGTLTIPAGQTTGTITVPVVGDTRDEPDETFQVNLSNASGARLTDSQGLGTITDDDPAPHFLINDATATEGDSGTVDAVFHINLSAPSGRTVTATYRTADGTATESADYVAHPATTLTFLPGETTKDVTVQVNGDTLDEGNETFRVLLQSATFATITDDRGVATITDDDPLPTISISDAPALAEGNAGATHNALFTVTLTPASGRTVTVNYTTANGTATSGSDYTADTGTITFTPNQTSKTLPIQVLGDATVEPDETFRVNLSGASFATISDSQGTHTIANDDASE